MFIALYIVHVFRSTANVFWCGAHFVRVFYFNFLTDGYGDDCLYCIHQHYHTDSISFLQLFIFFSFFFSLEMLAHSIVLLDHQDFCRHAQFAPNYFDLFSNYCMPFHSYLPDSHLFCFQETKLNHLFETGNKNSESLALQIINFGNVFCFFSFLYILICSTAHSISFRFRCLCSFFPNLHFTTFVWFMNIDGDCRYYLFRKMPDFRWFRFGLKHFDFIHIFGRRPQTK